MELTQKEIQWVKDKYALEQAMLLASQKDKLIQEARKGIEKKYEKQLKKLAEEGKIEERKALIEQMTQEANEAELALQE